MTDQNQTEGSMPIKVGWMFIVLSALVTLINSPISLIGPHLCGFALIAAFIGMAMGRVKQGVTLLMAAIVGGVISFGSTARFD